MKVYDQIISTARERGGVYAILIDPDRKNDTSLEEKVEQANQAGVDIILVGGSLMMDSRCHERVARIKAASQIPVVFFPGGLNQLNKHYDAMLFMSILSGRNPHYLIGEQVLAAPIVHDLGIETIPTGYLLFDGGASSAVQIMSNTTPLPLNRPDIAVAHALAAQFLGMKIVYLEAGSGAAESVPVETVAAVTGHLEIPVIVGGGIRTPDAARERIEVGASMIVTGTIFEDQSNPELMREFASAVHIKE